jgi:hypothetical protein
MSKGQDGLWITFQGVLAAKVAASIEYSNQFTTTIVTSDVHPRSAELAVVRLDISEYEGEYSDWAGYYFGISQAGRKVATGESTLVVSNLVRLPGVTSEQIVASLPKRLTKSFTPYNGAYRPTPKLWDALIAFLRSKLPEQEMQFNNLANAIRTFNKSVRSRKDGLDVFERDAIATAIQTWGGEAIRKRVLREAISTGSAPVASFLSQLSQVSIREDPQIIHDLNTFPGMEVARRDAIGSVVLGDENGYLTILNCNRQPLEETLGVDLIYFSHQYESFILVQYKRMSDGANGPEYRPLQDASHQKELDRMIAASEALDSFPHQSSGVEGYRLSDGPFYIKLCEPKAKAPLDAGMVSGMYVPLSLWRQLLESPSVKGPRGGVVVTWENCVRRFSTSDFTRLLRGGWIGSAEGKSAALASIIETVLASGRMLIVGATSPRQKSRDYRRDTFGRFAEEDDQEAAI